MRCRKTEEENIFEVILRKILVYKTEDDVVESGEPMRKNRRERNQG